MRNSSSSPAKSWKKSSSVSRGIHYHYCSALSEPRVRQLALVLFGTSQPTWSPRNGTENRSVSEALQLVPSGKDGDLASNHAPDCVEIMRPSSNPNAGRRLSRKTLAICPSPLAVLKAVL